ncbi:MAG: hypothetical protein R3F30_06845 [Planctomycetota bacterium]
MRAGSLSDPRIVALLRTHFVCVHMPELCTKELIEDPADLALLERYHAALLRREPRHLTPTLFGGEREVFLTPDGELVDIFLSLNAGPQDQKQYDLANRARPEAAVRRFFEGARKVLARLPDGVPADLAALADGSAPAVAAAARLAPGPALSPPGSRVLRAHVRNDLPMYEGLVGSDDLVLDEAGLAALLPARAEVGAARAWPRERVLALARAVQPRGAGVLLRPADGSIEGEVRAVVVEVDGDRVRGRLEGRLAIGAPTAEERGRRDTYRPFRAASARVVGDFVLEGGRLRSLRLVSEDGEGRYDYGPRDRASAWAFGVELLLPPPQLSRGRQTPLRSTRSRLV